MATHSVQSLSTLDWLCLGDDALRARGVDPRSRVMVTGHERALQRPWRSSVGLWGGSETSEMISISEPHKAPVCVSATAFRAFKSRHALMTRTQFVRAHGSHDWTRADVALSAVEDAQQLFEHANGFRAVSGVAAHYAVARASVRARPLGLLPVEIVVWADVLTKVLLANCLSLKDWRDADLWDKAFLWDAERSAAEERFSSALHAPATLRDAELRAHGQCA